VQMAPVDLETARLRLRPLTAGDAAWYLAHFSRPEIVHGSGFPAPADLAAAEQELHAYALDLMANGTGMRWGITRRGSDELIGSIGYYTLRLEPIRQVEIGYDLAPEAWGAGLMTEALEAVIAYCFGPLGIERIEALVMRTNERSARVLRRARFECEATLPRHGTDEFGELTDELLFVRTAGADLPGA